MPSAGVEMLALRRESRRRDARRRARWSTTRDSRRLSARRLFSAGTELDGLATGRASGRRRWMDGPGCDGVELGEEDVDGMRERGLWVRR